MAISSSTVMDMETFVQVVAFHISHAEWGIVDTVDVLGYFEIYVLFYLLKKKSIIRYKSRQITTLCNLFAWITVSL